MLRFSCLVLLFAAVTCSRAAVADTAGRPNVILIMTDDQGYGDLGCNGNPVLQTPNLDRLSEQSVRLVNFHTDPTCSPTRSALMSGRYSTRVGVWHTVMGRHMPRAEETLMPKYFRAAGYRTAMFGKWHLGDCYPFRPQDRGFDLALAHGGGGVGQIPDYWGNDYFDDTYLRNGKPEKFDGYCTDVFFREALRFIEANRERPFFVYLATNAPHGPFLVDKKYSRPYADKTGGDEELAHFYGMIANIDENMGKLTRRLDELGLAENTLLVFLTDNGTSRGAVFETYRGNGGHLIGGYNAGMRGRKGSPYEGGHRTPCFVRWPAGKLHARDVARLTAHFDLLPTFIDLCGLPAPAGVELDGMSIAPLLRGDDDNWPSRTLLAHHQELPLPEKWRYCSVMTDRWRLVHGEEGEELFDMTVDPGQKHDVSGDHQEVVKQLRGEYESLWDQFSQRFDEPSRIVIGSPKQNPTPLTCFDWHSSRRWWQTNIRSGFSDNGFWELKVAAAGDYTITLRRWPEQVDKPLTVALGKGKESPAVRAKLQIGDVELTQPIEPGASSVRFDVKLPAGETRLQTWLIDDASAATGAYYARVERESPSRPRK